MLEKSFLNPNKIWFMIVLLHIIGSVLVSLLGIFPFGIVIATTGIWFLLANIWERNLKNIGICITGWLITIFTMHSLNISFQGTVLLNEILLLYVCWCCKKAYVKPTEYCHLKKVSLKSTFCYCCYISVYYGRLCKCLFYDRISELIRCFFRRNFRASTRSDDCSGNHASLDRRSSFQRNYLSWNFR